MSASPAAPQPGSSKAANPLAQMLDALVHEWTQRDSRRSLDRWLVVASGLALVHFFSFPFRTHPIVTDIRYFLYFAQQGAHGAVPYRDLFDPKTPLATLTGALLHRLAEIFATDPIVTIRVGYLGLATVAAVLAFQVHRTIFTGGAVAGFLGLAPQLGFVLLGLLPCVGNIPKLLMALFMSSGALAVASRRWILAGMFGALAFLDWQIGVLALIGAVAAAWTDEGTLISRATVRVLVGAGLVLISFALYFAAEGALGEALQQTVVVAFARGSTPRMVATPSEEWARRLVLVRNAVPGQMWLIVVSCAGLILFPFCLKQASDPAARRSVTSLGVCHYGIVLFSIHELQGFGDCFALLHSFAFFAAIALNQAWRGARLLAGSRGLAPRRLGWLAGASILAVGLAATQPWILRADSWLPTADVGSAGFSLADQRAMARGLALALRDRRLAVFGPSELLILGGMESALPFVYWNSATYARYRTSADESQAAALERILTSASIESVIAQPSSRVVALIADDLPTELEIGRRESYPIDVLRYVSVR